MRIAFFPAVRFRSYHILVHSIGVAIFIYPNYLTTFFILLTVTKQSGLHRKKLPSVSGKAPEG